MELLTEPTKTPTITPSPALRLIIRKAYIHGEGSIRELCEKHFVSPQTGANWAKLESWGKLRSAWITSRELKDSAPDSPAIQPQDAQPAPKDYLGARLTRVREQLDRIDEMMVTEIDPQKLDRLASAQMRLAEQERLLAGRPLPGSMRPSPAPTRRQSQAYTAPMIEDDVAPQPAPAVTKPKTYDGPETG